MEDVPVSGFETLAYEKSDGIARITLNRPNHLNAYNIRMRDELYEVLEAIRDDNEVRVGILRGAGRKAFCAGADLSEFLTAPPPVKARRARFDRDIWRLFLGIRQSMIAALHGYVLGSGIEMALCCDIRIASEDSRFGLPEVGLGIIPAAGGTQTLPRAIGVSRALELLLTNRWIDADEALALGLVNRVVSATSLMDTVEEAAKKIASLDPMAVRCAKQAVVRGMDLPLADGLNLERLHAASLNARRLHGVGDR
ncbi:MAG: enoyl-CoA hydratase/isomerase family protein [Deltaproteobacteria bacterium]|nr:enoyl-CoA hydratase/isomerase family protein [Deltaproteobacteria bacterium]